MTYKIIDGDYAVGTDGDLVKTDYYDELRQRVLLNLRAQRNRFYPDKDFGSLLLRSSALPALPYALAFAQQAVAALDGVTVLKAGLRENVPYFKMMINNREIEVSMNDL